MIIKIVAVIVTILIRIIWWESSNDFNNDRIDKVIRLVIRIMIIGDYSNEKKIIIIIINIRDK